MKEGIGRIDLSDLSARHYKSQHTFTNISAADWVITHEGKALYQAANLLGDTIAEKREALEQIVDAALKLLYATA